MAEDSAPVQLQHGVLEPFTCIPKRNQKYASECTEVYLADQEAEAISENFRKFPNLEVVWFNMNRLTRLENLDYNFRIREVFVQDNRLVSLSGLKNCKFLRVLLASNNQIRNLEKQLPFISKFRFLKKLELSGNPIADEPEYRLRLVYNAPQVEIFDCAVVKDPERLKAAEVVPNLDKCLLAPPKKGRTKRPLSQIERDVFRETRDIKERDRKQGEEALTQMFTSFGSTSGPSAKTLQHRQFASNAQAWCSPRELLVREQPRPSAWEMKELRESIEKLAGKDMLKQADVRDLCEQLSREGVENLGRSLTTPDVFAIFAPPKPTEGRGSLQRNSIFAVPGSGHHAVAASASASGATTSRTHSKTPADLEKHPLAALRDPEATMPTKDVTKYLLTLDWHRQDEETLARRIDRLYADAKRADLAGNTKEQSLCQTVALRLEGAKDRLLDCNTAAKEDLLLGSARKPRADFFQQTMFRPQRLMDELTGRGCLHVSKTDKLTTFGG